MRTQETTRVRVAVAVVMAAAIAAGTLIAGTSGAPRADAVGAPDIVVTYEVRGLGNGSDLEQFAAQAAETYADGRGWGLGGSIAFQRVGGGGDFTLWLSAAGNLPGFGSPCSAQWSCRVGRNVIINEDRWLGASDAWNAGGGSLRDYRHMVVNHETGHWLGFGHPNCSGPGQPAPVMQQQSISLQGCTWNPWPLDWEREQVAASRGVAIRIGTPIGSLDSVAPWFRSVRVRGWVIDPDTAAPAQVHVYVDGAGYAFTAAIRRDGVAAAHPGYGAAHGFDVTVPAATGVRTVCAYGINVAGSGTNALLGCRTVVVGSPIGVLERVRTGPGTITVSGWALDPDTPASVPVHLYVGGRGTVLSAAGPRDDVAAAFAGVGSAHGFSAVVPAGSGTHQLCAYAVNTAGGGDNALLGCRIVTVGGPPVGSLDRVRVGLRSVQVDGWAIDPDTAAAIPVHVYVDGRGTVLPAAATRNDVARAFPDYGVAHGFAATIPAGSGTHRVCAYGINSAGNGANTLLGCKTVTVGGSPVGSLEAIRTGPGWVRVRGWSIDPDTPSSIPVHVYVDGRATVLAAADTRDDIGAALPAYGAAHGFREQIRAGSGTHRVCAYGIDVAGIGVNALLGCRTVTVGGSPIGALDAAVAASRSIQVRGWTIDPDTVAPTSVHVYVDGKGYAFRADADRPDVGLAHPDHGAAHGYAVAVPARPGVRTVCAYGINRSGIGVNTLLGCRLLNVPA